MEEKTESAPGNFTLTMLIAMVVGSMVGAGVFSLPHRFAASAGVFGSLVAWVVAGFGMFMLALVFQNLANRKPDIDAGGQRGGPDRHEQRTSRQGISLAAEALFAQGR